MDKEIRFAVTVAPEQAEIHTMPIPELEDNQVLVKLEACHICTTDYGFWTGARKHLNVYPMAGGHENSGVIVKKGAKVGDYLNIGDRVAFSKYYCGICASCKKGDTQNCEQPFDMRATFNGYYGGLFGFANYKVASADRVIKFNNKDLPAEEAAFMEPVSTVVSGIRRVGVKPLDNVVVIGAGTMGVLNAQVARLFGARVIVSEMVEKKVAVLKKLGFKDIINPSEEDPVEAVKRITHGYGADKVIIAAGFSSANEQALQMVRDGGNVLFFAAGYPEPELTIGSNAIHYRRIGLIGTINCTEGDMVDAAKILDNRMISVEPLIEARFKLDDIQEAYKVASTPGNYRVCVEL